jgi:hypothetical protein
MKERKIMYVSETVLPEQINRLLADTEKYILTDKNEPDKILCHLSWLKRGCIAWFLNNSKE